MDGPALVVRQESPFNAETPREALAADLHTPNDLFYVRSHLPAPRIAEKEYRLTVEGAWGVAEWRPSANTGALLGLGESGSRRGCCSSYHAARAYDDFKSAV